MHRKLIALALALSLGAAPVSAGIIVRPAEGLVVTGADGIHYDGPSGLVVTGADGVLGLGANGITRTSTDGLVVTGADGLVVTGADGLVVTGADGANVRAESADGLVVTGADGLVVTGADGLVVTGADGTTYRPASVSVRSGDGLVVTGADGLVVTGADGVSETANNGLVVTGADGLVVTGADTLELQNAQQVIATGLDGAVYSIPPAGLVVTGADGLVVTGADGISMTSVVGLVVTGADGLFPSSVNTTASTGLMSVDPILLNTLVQATDDSNINAAVVYHRPVTDTDIADLQRIGVTGGTRYHVLPAVLLTATKEQLIAISELPAVRSLYGNTTLQLNAVDTSRQTTGVTRARGDADLSAYNRGVIPSGNNVAVAVIDTGIDGTHPDLAGRVVRNVKLSDLQGLSRPGFVYPENTEGLRNTDLVYGHGTFVSGIIAGNSARTNGVLSGYAPGAQLVGLSVGDATLFHVLAGFDYVLQHRDALNIRVVNCSFSTNTVFNEHDPVNVATKMLADRGVNVVFSAGNTGPGPNTLNPYAVAPWVISVGATDGRGRPASFSSRGEFGSSVFRPTLTAPGVNVVSARSSGVSVTGTLGGPSDAQYISQENLPYYTTGSGTSFTAPQVAGTIALMLEANPGLTPAQVRGLLSRTATPLPPYFSHEVGSGMLNTHAAMLAAAFPQRHIGEYRSTLDRGQVRVYKNYEEFEGIANPNSATEITMTMPPGALGASVQVAWGPPTTTNDLALTVVSPRGEAKDVNTINLPGLTGKRESVSLSKPEAGAWSVRVGHAVGVAATPQTFKGVLEVTRVEYQSSRDLEPLSGTQTYEDARRALRNFVMFPVNPALFGASRTATRAEFAAALVLGARVPLYVPAQPRHPDLYDISTSNFVESAQAAPGGALFPQSSASTAFQPHRPVDRLAAAIALVRGAGLQAEAERQNAGFLLYHDANLIPSQYQGYVRVAVARGLLTSDPTLFNPRGTVSRAELARAMSVIERIYTE